MKKLRILIADDHAVIRDGLSMILGLQDDIALNLAAAGVRIEAPIPGKAAVGVEVPNRVKDIVTIREMIESEEFARGIIDGYFEGKVSRDFFKMLKYYTSELIIKESEKTLDSKVVENIYSSYEDYNLEIPKWYKK